MNGLQPKRSAIFGLQLHYTSCRHGISGHAGFQTRAISRDIRPDEQRAIERLGMYQAPRDCPIVPDKQQIDDMFPIAYRNSYLDTGNLAVSRSVYVGKDYTGRGGNYFSHALLIHEMPDNIWPVDLYEWDGWKKALEDTEDTEHASLDLPRTTIVADESAYSFAELQVFLTEENGRLDHLAKMIQAVRLRSETSRSIVIRESLGMNSLFWIACIQKSFPPVLQTHLSCSSYQFDPRGCLAVNALYGETDFSLGENERKFQFYVFDFIDKRHSSISGAKDEYANTISFWMCEHPERMKSFHDFSTKFEHYKVTDGLLSLLRLFRVNNNENISLSNDDLIEILDFVNRHTKKRFFADVSKIIDSSVSQLTKLDNPDYIHHFAVFFINGAKATEDGDLRLAAYKQILRLVDNVIFDNAPNLGKLETVRSSARDAFDSCDYEFSQLFLSDQHLSRLNSNIGSMSSEGLAIAMEEIVAAITVVSVDQKVLEDERLLEFLKARLIAIIPDLSSMDWLFSSFGDTQNEIAAICIYVCKVLDELEKANEIEQGTYDDGIKSFSLFLSKMFNSKGDEFRFNFINILKDNPANWKLLEEEWKHSISHQSNQCASHELYYQRVLKQDSEFSKEYRPEFAEELWKLLSPRSNELGNQAKEWIKSNQISHFPSRFRKNVFQKASEYISFGLDDGGSDALYELIDAKKRDFNIELQPDRLSLRRAILMSNDNTIDYERQSVIEIGTALGGIDKKSYRGFTDSYLPRIFRKTSVAEQHGTVIKYVFISKWDDVFLAAYKRFFVQGKTEKLSDAEMVALCFWVSLTSNDNDYNTFESLQKRAFDLLASRIAVLKDNDYDALLLSIENMMNVDPDAKNNWDAVLASVESKKKSFFGSLLRRGFELLRKKKLGIKDV